MAAPLVGLIAKKALGKMAAAAASNLGGKKGSDKQPVTTTPTILSETADLSGTSDPFAEELSGMKRGEVRLAESDAPTKTVSSTKKDKKETAPKKDKKPLNLKKGIGKASAALNVMSEQMNKSGPVEVTPTILSKMPSQNPATGLTDAFDKIAQQRNSVAKNLMG